MIELAKLIAGNNVEIDKQHAWGFEIRCVNNERYCGKFLVITNPHVMSSLHYHKLKDETFCIMSGEVNIETQHEGDILKSSIYTAGKQIRIQAGVRHRLYSYSPLSVILEVSTHHDDSDTFRVIKGGQSV